MLISQINLYSFTTKTALSLKIFFACMCVQVSQLMSKINLNCLFQRQNATRIHNVQTYRSEPHCEIQWCKKTRAPHQFMMACFVFFFGREKNKMNLQFQHFCVGKPLLVYAVSKVCVVSNAMSGQTFLPSSFEGMF